MADYYTSFSFSIDVTPEQREWCRTEIKELWDYFDREEPDTGSMFDFAIEDDCVYIFQTEYGDVETAAQFAQRFLERWDPTGVIGFEWAETCSKPRP